MTVNQDIVVDGQSGHCGGQSTGTLWTTFNQDTMDDSHSGLVEDGQSGHCGGLSIRTLYMTVNQDIVVDGQSRHWATLSQDIVDDNQP